MTMPRALRPLLMSLMLGLAEAMRLADAQGPARPAARWVMRLPAESPLDRVGRCWLWGQSPLAN